MQKCVLLIGPEDFAKWGEGGLIMMSFGRQRRTYELILLGITTICRGNSGGFFFFFGGGGLNQLWQC